MIVAIVFYRLSLLTAQSSHSRLTRPLVSVWLVGAIRSVTQVLLSMYHTHDGAQPSQRAAADETALMQLHVRLCGLQAVLAHGPS